MTAPSLHERPIEHQSPRQVPDSAPYVAPSRGWSFTARTDPSELDSALVVYRLSAGTLRIDDLAREVSARCGAAEGRRWLRERAREYVVRVRDQLRLHLPTTEIIVHADEGDADHLQVVVTVPSGEPSETARLEQETAERVRAIIQHTWIGWAESLRLTLATLRSLEEAL